MTHLFYKLLVLTVLSIAFLLTTLRAQELETSENSSAETTDLESADDLTSEEPVAEVTGIVQEDTIRRMETMMLLQKNLEEALKLSNVGEYEKATQRFNDILERTKTGNWKDVRGKTIQGMINMYAVQAQKEEANNNFQQAAVFWRQALNLNPENQELRNALTNAEKFSDPLKLEYPDNTAVNTDLKNRIDLIEKLRMEAEAYESTGQYTRARGRYEAILEIDPYNTVANDKLKRLIEKLKYYAKQRYMTRREKAMNDVEQKWVDSNTRRSFKDAKKIQTDEVEQTNSIEIINKLDTITIPQLNFNAVDIVDAIDFIQQQSVEQDPEGEGVNIILKLPKDENIIPISLDLQDIPLFKVIQFISNVANLQFQVEEHAVLILSNNDTTEQLQQKTFNNVPPDLLTTTAGDTPLVNVQEELQGYGIKFPQGSQAIYLPKTGRLIVRNTLQQINDIQKLIRSTAEAEDKMVEIQAKFIEYSDDELKDLSFNYRLAIDVAPGRALQGIIPTPTSPQNTLTQQSSLGSTFNTITPANGAAAVNTSLVNTPGTFGLDKTSVVASSDGLRGYNALNQNALDSLLNAGNRQRSPSHFYYSGIIGGRGVEMLMTMMDSTFKSDLIASPKVIVQNQGSAVVRIVREFRYPSPEDFDPVDASITVDDGATTIEINPAAPTSYEVEEIGVVLNVNEVQIDEERDVISLGLEPQIVDFEGFLTYGSSIIGEFPVFVGGDLVGFVNTVLGNGALLAPVFNDRKVSTQVDVYDGMTIILGGIIDQQEEKVEDKVPMLGDFPLVGRFFRSESSSKVSRNLMIMVTPRIIQSDGTPSTLNRFEEDELAASLDIKESIEQGSN